MLFKNDTNNKKAWIFLQGTVNSVFARIIAVNFGEVKTALPQPEHKRSSHGCPMFTNVCKHYTQQKCLQWTFVWCLWRQFSVWKTFVSGWVLNAKKYAFRWCHLPICCVVRPLKMCWWYVKERGQLDESYRQRQYTLKFLDGIAFTN